MQGPGWYADPGGKAGAFRWWDGGGWTRWLSRDRAAADPGPEPQMRPEPVEGPLQDVALDFLPPEGEPAGDDDQREAPRRTRPGITVMITALMLAVIAGGAIVSLNEDRMPTGPAVPPPPPVQSMIKYEPDLVRVSFEELTYAPPGEPFSCEATPVEKYPTFSSRHSCFAFVHENYDAAGADWVATVNLGVVRESLTTPDDLDRTADAVFESIIDLDYAGDTVTAKKREEQSLDLGVPGRSRLISAEVHFSIKGLPSTYDRVVVAVTELESGAYAAWYAIRADDAPKSMRTILTNSAGTLRARK